MDVALCRCFVKPSHVAYCRTDLMLAYPQNALAPVSRNEGDSMQIKGKSESIVMLSMSPYRGMYSNATLRRGCWSLEFGLSLHQ